jgi:Recombination endonuclease VII
MSNTPTKAALLKRAWLAKKGPEYFERVAARRREQYWTTHRAKILAAYREKIAAMTPDERLSYLKVVLDRGWKVRLRQRGLTPETYQELFDRQQGLCAICHQPETQNRVKYPGKRLLQMDHDHKTGKLRDLLCGRCNIGLGKFDESPELLEAAAAYLRRHT